MSRAYPSDKSIQNVRPCYLKSRNLNYEHEINVTLNDIDDVRRHMQDELGSEYEIGIEEITEGGIVFKKFPGKTDEEMYKTIRFPCHGVFPFIGDTTDWGRPFNFVTNSSNIKFKFKVLNGAPNFTDQEKGVFIRYITPLLINKSNKELKVYMKYLKYLE